MNSVFPTPIQELPEADLPFLGAKAFLSQSSDHQILFMEFTEDLELPEHSHGSQWGAVLQGHIELCIGGLMATYVKGDTYFVPDGVKHSGRIYAGYSDITFFSDRDRYMAKIDKEI